MTDDAQPADDSLPLSDRPTRKIVPAFDSARAASQPVVAPPAVTRIGMRWQEAVKALAEGKIIVNVAGDGVKLCVENGIVYNIYGKDGVFPDSAPWCKIGDVALILPTLTVFELSCEEALGADAPLWWTAGPVAKRRQRNG